MTRNRALLFGIAATLLAAFLWHGPGGAGERLARHVDGEIRRTLDHYEMQSVQNRLQRGPLMRRMIFTGPADEFQRTEIVRIAEELPGIAEGRWNRPKGIRLFPLPLLVEAMLMALVAFAAGAIVAYVFALRARNPY
jgi:hypothetical protein